MLHNYAVRPAWFRILLSLLVIPLIVVSCTSIPQAGTGSASSASSPQGPPPPSDPQAYYHFMLGHQAELAQDFERAIREYQAAYRSDPSSIYLQTRLAGVRVLEGVDLDT